MSARVLCAVDINHPEKRLLERAAQVAKLDKAELNVITVMPGFGMSLVSDYFKEGAAKKMLEDARQALHKLTTETLGAETDSKVRHIVAEGTVYEEILRTAKKIGADLIIMGSHRPDLKDFLLGPNAARVSRHANCSVYILRL